MKFKKITLKNGLRIITVPMTGTETVTVLVMVGIGSRYESEKEAGLSHFIEHMFFKGTQKRPTTLDISSELDSVGGEYNAFTSKDTTGYYAKVDAQHIDTALDVVSDIFLNSKIDEKEIEKEKGAILQELNMYEDIPMKNLGDVFDSLLYGKNPLGREIIGYKKNIKSFKREDFINYINRYYLANDTVICVSGKFDEKKVLDQIKKYFNGMRQDGKAEAEKVEERQKKPELKIKFKKTDQTHLMIGARAYDLNHKDRFALGLLSVILGGNMSSRLFIEVREKRGLAYYIRSSVESFFDAGHIVAQAGVEHGKLELAVKTILEEYGKIASQKVGADELKRAKDFIKGKSVMGMESSDEVAMFHIDQEMSRKKIMTMKEVFSHIDKVTSDDILRVAKDIFKNEKLNMAIIGPHKNNQNLRSILKL